MVFMLVSYIILPAQKTRSHYLSVCLIVSVTFITIGFTIPLAAQPEQCYNEITPNDMYSSGECAWSGAFIIAGGLCATMWIFIRALSMNLQICWDIVPGKRFFYISQALGWGIPAVLFTATMTVTGVSFRFGNACHVNHATSMKDFWGPLMGFAAAAGVLQIMTFAYCIHVYLKNLWTDDAASTNTSGSQLPSYSASVRTQTARAVYRRLKKVLWLQWRGIVIVTIILVDVIFFAIVFVYLDSLQSAVLRDWTKVEPWLACLALNPTDKNQCLGLVKGWLVNEPIVVAVLILLSFAGIQVFLFLTRPEIFPAWGEFLHSKFSSRQEFVSLDARPDVMRTNSKQELLRYDLGRGRQSTTFEMQKPQFKELHLDIDRKGALSPTQSTVISSPDETYRSPLHAGRADTPELDSRSISPNPFTTNMGRSRIPPEYVGRVTPDLHPHHRPLSPNTSNPLASPATPAISYNSISLHRQPSDYFTQPQQRAGYARELTPDLTSSSSPPQQQQEGGHARSYNQPHMSFSAPKTPSRQSSLKSVTFDPMERYARGGLALNPPSEAGESAEELGGGVEGWGSRRQSQSVDTTRNGNGQGLGRGR